MTTYGVTDTGFIKKTLDVILTEFESKQREKISDIIDVSSDQPLGQINGIVAEATAELWDLAEAVYKAFDPDQNSGDAQDAVCAITGTVRLPATRSKITAALATLDAGRTLPAGSLASVRGSTTAIFSLDASITNPGASPAQIPGNWTAVATGPTQALAGTLTVIKTPVSGWTGVTNPTDAALGRNVEGPAALRRRRDDELEAQGTSPVDAIAADVSRALGGLQVRVYENTTDITDANYMPPHSVEVVVYNADAISDATIAAAVWTAKAGGVQTYGNDSGTVVDSNGDTQTVYFTRPTPAPIDIAVTLSVAAEWDGEAAVKEAMLAVAARYLAGTEVVRNAYIAPCFQPGVIDVLSLAIGFDGGTMGTTNLVVPRRSIATLDSSNITITV
jgi:uncharacterized phage protein gp47/JayE